MVIGYKEKGSELLFWAFFFWGLRLASLVGATFRSSLFARPFSAKALWSGPSGHCCTSLGLRAFGPAKPKYLVQLRRARSARQGAQRLG